MKKQLIIAVFAGLCIVSCSSDTETTLEVQNIPEIVDLVSMIPDSSFDITSKGKYVGIFGHHQNQRLHGKIYINAGLDTRYTSLIALVNGEELRFTGIQTSRSNPNLIYFEGKSGNFTVDFSNYENPEVTSVFINGTDTEAYIVLAKSTSGGNPFVFVGSYVDSLDPTFFGNWDLIANPGTEMATPFVFMGIPGTALTQEIITLAISHSASMTPFISNTPDDFDINIAVACAPVGVVIPTTEPVIIDVLAFGESIGAAISAGGQTSMINGIEATWSFNYTTDIVLFGTPLAPEGYVADDCSPVLSGTWSWNGRSGTTTAL